jgi:hypothetical protein
VSVIVAVPVTVPLLVSAGFLVAIPAIGVPGSTGTEMVLFQGSNCRC